MALIGEKEKKEIIENFKVHTTDTGSSHVQIALLTERINHLVEHLKANKKDHHTRRGLLILVGRRRKLINYMKKRNPELLVKLAKELKIKLK
jgi:small subunit ribosomal protein S15